MLGIYKKFHFWLCAPRIGPDMPLTHLLLYSKRAGHWLARRKLKLCEEGAEIRPAAYLVETKHISLGRNVVIRPGCKLFAVPDAEGRGQIIIEDNVLIGSDVHIYVSNHRFSEASVDIYHQGHDTPKRVRIMRGAWLGAGVIVLPGVTIGRNAVIGAGSVVTRDVGDFQVAIGAPARIVDRSNR
ncbi:acyltransferase (plasmid) [Ensifer adhaerens]|uniref:acyltransferase n=1 Tax=Ensifer TaxID=106591 RepID=UPI002100ADDC|nr:acyltransferase [Ensifer adhaerens]UTV39257.1 acyltransferase [Ensifer adhaerens]